MHALGIDIGGSGIKGAPVNADTGEFITERHRIETPSPSTPEAVCDAIEEIVKRYSWQGRPVGCGFPGITRNGVIYSAANVDKSWMEVDAAKLFSEQTGCPVTIVNDADAAGIAEMTLGAGKGRMGVTFVLTLGTGIGTALFTDGRLVPNVELGHLKLNGTDAELQCSAAARKRDKLKWPAWAERFNVFLNELEALFSPDLFILGGGISKKTHKYVPLLDVNAEIIPAEFLNQAGIIGAAMSTQATPEINSVDTTTQTTPDINQ